MGARGSLGTFGGRLLLTLALLQGAAPAQSIDFPAFPDVASEVGLTVMNLSGEGANDYIIEANGNGAAFVDYDNDDDLTC